MRKRELKTILTIYKTNMMFTNSRVRDMITHMNKLDAVGIYEGNTKGIRDEYYQDFAEIIYGYYGQITRIRRLLNFTRHNKTQHDMVKRYITEFRSQLWAFEKSLSERYCFCTEGSREIFVLNEQVSEIAMAIYLLDNIA